MPHPLRKSEPPSFDPATLADALRPIVLRLSRRLRRMAHEVGVSAVDAQLLGVIKSKAGIGVSELADIEQISRPAMSMQVKRLEAAGLVARELDPQADADRRRTRLVLTAAGAAAHEAVQRSRTDWIEARLAGLDENALAAIEAALPGLRRLVEIAP